MTERRKKANHPFQETDVHSQPDGKKGNRVLFGKALLFLTAIFVLANSKTGRSQTVVQFQDVTSTSLGSNITSVQNQAIVDYDGDGDLDLFWGEIDAASHLFVNRSDKSTFAFIDEATTAGLEFSGLGFDCSAVFWDFDSDGFPDLYVGRNGYAGYHMVNQGNGTFQDNGPASGLMPSNRTTSMSPIDYNLDGHLDMYFGQGAWNLRSVDLLFRNNGDGTFEDVTTAVGLGVSTKGAGALPADYDLDGDTDLYVVQNGANLFYINNGDGTFSELSGIGVADGSIASGAAAADYDNDGDMDIFVANDGLVNLFRNNYLPTGTLDFTDVAALAGVDQVGDSRDAAFGDIDNDGDLDLMVATNGPTPTWLYLNNGDGTFDGTTSIIGFPKSGNLDGTRCAFADFNGDGLLDFVMAGEDAVLMKNISIGTGHWLEVGLQGTSCTLEAIGARVVLSAGGKEQMRERQIGRPRGSQNSPWLHFGLGDHASSVTVTVAWPGGDMELFAVDSVDRQVVLVEGDSLFLKPRNILPVSNAVNISLTPTLEASVPNPFNRIHVASQWQVREESGPADYSQTVFDSGVTDAYLTSRTIPPTVLKRSTQYQWRVRYRGDDGVWSGWSGETSFTAFSSYALQFDGVNDYVDIPSDPSLDLRDSFTVSAWVKNDGDDLGCIVHRGDSQFRRDTFLLAVVEGKMRLYVSGSIEHIVISPEQMDNEYHFWTGVHDKAAGKLLLFKDGLLVASINANVDFDFDSSSMPVSLGAADSGTVWHFSGQIGEVRIWNHARTQMEISRDMKRLLNGDETGLVGYWTFHEGSGQTLNDQTANQNHGRLGFSSETNDSDPLWVDWNGAAHSNFWKAQAGFWTLYR